MTYDDELEDDLDAFVIDGPSDAASLLERNNVWIDNDGAPRTDDPPVVSVDGEEHADRLLRRVMGIDRKVDKILTLAARRRAEVDAWEADRTYGLRRDRERVVAALEGFMRAVNARAPKIRSLALPSGTLALRKGQPKVTGDLPSVAVKDYPTVATVDLVVKLDRTAARQVWKADAVITADDGDGHKVCTAVDVNGAIVPGVTIRVPLQDGFSLTVGPKRTEADDE